MLLFSSGLFGGLAHILREAGERHLSWLGLSLFFFYMAIDEFTFLHERLTIPTRDIVGTSGFFYFAWIIPNGTVLLVLISI